MNGRFSVKGLSKGRPACPSIFFSDFSGKDRALLVQQIGGANAGRGMNFSSKFVLGVVNRCLYGNARVLLCRCMKDGVPFPTSFWLVCPHLVKVAGRLEAENGVASMEAASAEDAAVWLSFHTMHARLRMCLLHAARRKFMRAYRGNMYRSLCLGGVGGALRSSGRGNGVVVQGLRNAPENQPDSHACGEEHGEPAHQRVGRGFVVGAEGDVPVRSEGHQQGESDETRNDEAVVPAQPVDHGCVRRLQQIAQPLRCHRREPDETQNDHSGGDCDRRFPRILSLSNHLASLSEKRCIHFRQPGWLSRKGVRPPTRQRPVGLILTTGQSRLRCLHSEHEKPRTDPQKMNEPTAASPQEPQGEQRVPRVCGYLVRGISRCSSGRSGAQRPRACLRREPACLFFRRWPQVAEWGKHDRHHLAAGRSRTHRRGRFPSPETALTNGRGRTSMC